MFELLKFVGFCYVPSEKWRATFFSALKQRFFLPKLNFLPKLRSQMFQKVLTRKVLSSITDSNVADFLKLFRGLYFLNFSLICFVPIFKVVDAESLFSLAHIVTGVVGHVRLPREYLQDQGLKGLQGGALEARVERVLVVLAAELFAGVEEGRRAEVVADIGVDVHGGAVVERLENLVVGEDPVVLGRDVWTEETGRYEEKSKG